MKTVKVVVTGKVQGVWFRAHTRDRARELGLRGSVRNLADGGVEIVAQGKPEAVEALVDWARVGPPLAHVLSVRVEELPNDEERDPFDVQF